MGRLGAIAVVVVGCGGGASPDPTGSGGPAGGVGTGVVAGLPSTTAPAELPTLDLTLDEVGARILGPLMAGRDTEAWSRAPGPARADLAEVSGKLAVGDTDVAGLLEARGFEVGLVRDESNGRDVVVVWEPEPDGHRGALLVALGPARPVVVESPHPLFDSQTGAQGLEAFVALEARAWLVATSHRCANAAATSCDGTSSACTGVSEAFRESDAAHNVESGFQAFHEGLLDADPTLVAVQLHGFAQGASDPDVFASLGSTEALGSDTLSNRLAAELDGAGLDGASCNLAADVGIARLCATTNTQGRHANGSSDACDLAPSTAGGRFLHVEQARSLRDPGSPVIDALDAVLPR